MADDRIEWDDNRPIGQWAARAACGDRRPMDVYEEWLAATKVAYTQGG